MPLYGAIEAGGTKWVCAVGSGPDDLRAVERFPTTTPAATIAQAVAFLEAHAPLAAVGVGSFGPIDVHPGSPTYGYITTTPKPGWQYADVAGPIGRALGCPVGWDTDVNAAALGEHRWGAARGLDTFIYITVGTGIGGGVMVGGALLHGLLHPEIGHMRLPRDPARDPFAGVCPFHGDCLEGLAAGPALLARWGVRGEELPADHPAWELEGHYLGLAATNLVLTLSPQRIVVGGGVVRQPAVLPAMRRTCQLALNSYVQMPQILAQIDEYIVAPGLGDRAGILGALALAVGAAGVG